MHESHKGLRSRILIVDDQRSNIRLLEHTLSRGGYVAVSSTSDPQQVAELHLRSPFDLIVLDLQMPGMNGYQVMESLELSSSDRPVILVMSADPAQADRVIAAGADSFLAKPYVLADVLSRVHRLLDQKASPDHELAPAA